VVIKMQPQQILIGFWGVMVNEEVQI